MPMCIYCTSVYALTSLALFAFKPQSSILKASLQRDFFKRPLTAMEPFWLYPVPLIAVDLFLHLFVELCTFLPAECLCMLLDVYADMCI